MDTKTRLQQAAISAVPTGDLSAPSSVIRPDMDVLDDVAGLFETVGTNQFYPSLRSLMLKVVPFDDFLVIVYRPDAPPTSPFTAIEASNEKCGSFAGGLFRQSPFYQFSQTGQSGLRALRDLVASDFSESAFYRDYMRPSRLSDEIGFTVQTENHQSIVISMGRARRRPMYTESCRMQLDRLTGLVDKSVLRHVALTGGANRTVAAHDGNETFTAYSQLGQFARDVLTDRENEIVAYLIKGYTSKACANKLEISPATERVHRKNIYLKLGVHSQGELQALALC